MVAVHKAGDDPKGEDYLTRPDCECPGEIGLRISSQMRAPWCWNIGTYITGPLNWGFYVGANIPYMEHLGIYSK